MIRLLGVFFIVSALASGCGPAPTEAKEVDLSDCLQQHIAGEVGSLDMDVCVPEPWSNMVILTPYCDPEQTALDSGISLPLPSNLRAQRIEDNDGICILMFAHEGSVSAWAPVPRGTADFTGPPEIAFTRQQAIFRIQPRPTDGWPFVRHVDDAMEPEQEDVVEPAG